MSSNTIQEAIYTGSVTSEGGRGGHISSAEEGVDFDMTLPKVMGGDDDASGPNPEVLFGAAYAACYESALRSHAKSQSVDASNASVKSVVTLGKTEQGDFQLGVILEASIPGVEKDQVQALMESAHKTCPYSRATRGNVNVELVAK